MQVELHGVGVTYGKHRVFDNFNAVFSPNRVTALVGPSGSGKSSVLAVIAGYVRPSAGNVILRDDEGTALAPWPDVTAWISQSANSLGRRSVLDNVMLGASGSGRPLRDARRHALEQLDYVGLLDRASALVNELSGGELQRVAFARALSAEKSLVLADEPSASLDEDNTRNLAELLGGLRGTSTVIVATHDPVLIRAAESVVSLRQSYAT